VPQGVDVYTKKPIVPGPRPNPKIGNAVEESEAEREARDLAEFHEKGDGGKYAGLGGARARTGPAYEKSKKNWLGARAGQRFLKKQPKENLMSKLKVEPYEKGLSSFLEKKKK
jgi:hypothetical protein